MTRNQVIFIGASGVAILLLTLIFTGVIPGLREARKPFSEIDLEVWGVFDKSSAFSDVILQYQKARPEVSVRYRELNQDTYEADLINALASGAGPDIFMFHNTWLPKHFTKVEPLPKEQLSLADFKSFFPRVAEQDFAPDGDIYALPLYVDTLALIYNKDIFDNRAIALPPKTWPETQEMILKTREIDKGGQIKVAGAAIGGSDQSINRATDLLSLLMLQTGVQMTNSNFTSATFAQDGEQSLTFYTKFADPKNKYYTWNNSLHYSLDNFAEGGVAMIFNYAYNLANLRLKNPFLRIGVAEMPQPDLTSQRVDYANYFGLSVAANSQNIGYGWDFIKFVTTKPEVSRVYLQKSGHPPALRSLVDDYLKNENLAVFARQSLTARSWPQVDNVAVENSFSDMIDKVVTGRLDTQKAIFEAQSTLTGLMRRR